VCSGKKSLGDDIRGAGVKVGSNYEPVASLWVCNKRFGVCNIFTSAIFLEFMEVKKLPVLLGCCMDKYSIPVASGGADDQVLEDFSAAETAGWLGQCTRLPEEDGRCTGAVTMEISEG
jgi:hypothetical protein